MGGEIRIGNSGKERGGYGVTAGPRGHTSRIARDVIFLTLLIAQPIARPEQTAEREQTGNAGGEAGPAHAGMNAFWGEDRCGSGFARESVHNRIEGAGKLR